MQRQSSVASMSDARIIAMQSRDLPSNALVNRMFGSVAPGTELRGVVRRPHQGCVTVVHGRWEGVQRREPVVHRHHDGPDG